MPKKEKKDKTKTAKKDKTKLKNKNKIKNKNTVVVNVNSHNKDKATENKNPQPMMPFVINAPQSQPQSQPIIIQQPAQPNYLHYQPPNAVHLGSQNPVNASVPMSNNFQSPRRMPVRIPISNVIETQTEITGTGLNETLQQYQKRIEDLNNETEAFKEIARRSETESQNKINALQERLQVDRETIDDMNEFIANLRREKDETTSNAESLFLQLNREREENQLLDRQYQDRLKMEEENRHLLKEELFATQMEKNKLKFIIEDEERNRGKLIEGKRKQQSPNPDNKTPLPKNSMKNYVQENTPMPTSLESAFKPINPAATQKQITMDKYIAPLSQNQQSNFLDSNAVPFTQQMEVQNASPSPISLRPPSRTDIIEERDDVTVSPLVKASKPKKKEMHPDDRRDLIKSLMGNKQFVDFLNTKKDAGLEAKQLRDGNYEIIANGKKVNYATLIDFGIKYL